MDSSTKKPETAQIRKRHTCEDWGHSHVHNQHEHLKRYNFSCNVSIKTGRSQQLLPYFSITRFEHFPAKSDTCQSWSQHAKYCFHIWYGKKKLSYYKVHFCCSDTQTFQLDQENRRLDFCCHKTSPEIVFCSFLTNILPIFSVSLNQSQKKKQKQKQKRAWYWQTI